jgi:DNA-binding transcriptional LysR family regulator
MSLPGQRVLRAFVTVADELHVGRAAVRLQVSQPSLSRQIAALERDVGVPLFARVRRRLTLTPAGEVFLLGAREILRRTDEAVRDAHRADRGELGTLRLGFVQSATFEALPRLLGAFRSTCPDVVIDARSVPTLRQLVALRSGELDVGLLRPVGPAGGVGPDLATRVIARDPLVAVLPAHHRLAANDRVALGSLADEPFVFYLRDAGPWVHDTIIGHCLAAGFSPRIVQEATEVQTIASLVAAGLGVSLIIGPPPPGDSSTVVYRPLAADLPSWVLALAWAPDNPSTSLERFLAVADGVIGPSPGAMRQ